MYDDENVDFVFSIVLILGDDGGEFVCIVDSNIININSFTSCFLRHIFGTEIVLLFLLNVDLPDGR